MIIDFQPQCCVQGRQPPDQAAQSHIQPGLECLQGWGCAWQSVMTSWTDLQTGSELLLTVGGLGLDMSSPLAF